MSAVVEKELSDRELDAAIAERVMGWWNRSGIWCSGEVGSVGSGTGWISYPVSGAAFQYALGGREYGEYTPQSTYDADAERRVFAPSTDIAAAMQVIAKLERDNMISLAHCANLPTASVWTVSLSSCGPGYIDVCGEAKTLPEAICLAALKAVGHTQESKSSEASGEARETR